MALPGAEIGIFLLSLVFPGSNLAWCSSQPPFWPLIKLKNENIIHLEKNN
jgi:hypothetical protein